MSNNNNLAKGLHRLANKFSEGWHDWPLIDVSDIVLLLDAAKALSAPVAPVAVPLVSPCTTCNGMGYLDGQGTVCGKCGGEGSGPYPMWRQMGAESAEQWELFKARQAAKKDGCEA